MTKQISPTQAIVAIVIAIIVIGGIWWFVRGRGPAQSNPAEVERMLQQNPSPAPPGAAIR
jgi:hypothetical protein